MSTNKNDQAFDTKLKLSYFAPKYWGSWLGILFLGILAFIPSVIRDAFATLLAKPFSRFDIMFKKRAILNFRYAFPELSDEEHNKMYYDYIRLGAKAILGYGETFFRSKKFISKRFLVQGQEYLDEALSLNRPIIFMAPHTWTIDRGGLYLSASGLTMCTMMHTSKNEVFDWFMNSMRLKYGGKVFERSSGIKNIIRALKGGYHSFFLPDQDLEDATKVFVKLFASEKSTLTVLPKLARLTNAVIVPMFCCYNEDKRRYEVVFERYYQDYPSGDITKDARTMNESIERLIKTREKQYMWFLKIYQTRPDGTQDEYDRKSVEVRYPK